MTGQTATRAQVASRLHNMGKLLGVVIWVFLAVLFLIWVPRSMQIALQKTADVESQQWSQLDGVATVQREELQAVLAAQKQLATVKADAADLLRLLQDVNASLHAEDGPDGGVTAPSQTSFDAAVKKKIEELRKRAESAQERMKAATNDWRYPFLLKWHGPKGIQTSKRIGTEHDALYTFERIGDYAKKLLQLRRGTTPDELPSWTVLREYGASKWLEMLTNDAAVQGLEEMPP